MPQCLCIAGPFFPHFAGARAKGKRSFRSDWQHLASFRAFGAIGINNLRSHNWSVRYPNWSLIEAKWTLRTTCPAACKEIDLRTMDRLCVRRPNGWVGGQRKWRMEDVTFRFPSLAVWGCTVNPFYPRSTLVSSMRSGFHMHNELCLMECMQLYSRSVISRLYFQLGYNSFCL